MKKLFLLLAVAGFASACTKDKGPVEVFHYPSAGVFVTNEGTWQQENASLTYYIPDTGQAEQEVCNRANDKQLGDVCQSMTIIGKKGFVVMNNSQAVVAIDLDNFRYVGEIKGLTSPRYVLPVSADKIYISDMYSQYITIANPNTYEITGTIDLGTAPAPTNVNSSEQMVKYGDYVFVCSWSHNNKIFRIDTRTDRVVGEPLEVPKQPNSMVVDTNRKLWVLSDGGYAGSPYGNEEAALTRIDAATFTYDPATDVFRFSSLDDSPSKLTINREKERLYFLSMDWTAYTGGLYGMDITESAIPSESTIPGSFYGLGVDPANGDIYLAESLYDPGYAPINGRAYRYDSSEEPIDDFPTGLFPNGFCFKP